MNLIMLRGDTGREEINGSVLHSSLKCIVKVAKHMDILFKIAQNFVDIVESMVISLTIVSSRNGLINNAFLQETAMKKREEEVRNICPHLSLYSNILNLVILITHFSSLLLA